MWVFKWLFKSWHKYKFLQNPELFLQYYCEILSDVILIVRALCSRFLPLRDAAALQRHAALGRPGLLSDQIWQVLQNLKYLSIFFSKEILQIKYQTRDAWLTYNTTVLPKNITIFKLFQFLGFSKHLDLRAWMHAILWNSKIKINNNFSALYTFASILNIFDKSTLPCVLSVVPKWKSTLN